MFGKATEVAAPLLVALLLLVLLTISHTRKGKVRIMIYITLLVVAAILRLVGYQLKIVKVVDEAQA